VARRKRGRWTPDAARVARATARAGNDLREWIAYGTVAAMTGKDGGPSYTDPDAVVITPKSVDVDVVLEPHGYPAPCRWGVQSGKVFISTPIHPGDQVMVLIPGGDVAMVPEILRIITCPHSPIPTDDAGMPLFKNDRCLIYANGVPVDLRTSGGARVILDGDQVNMNEGSKGVARTEDATKLTLSQDDLAALAPRILAPPGTAGGPCTAAPGPPLVFEDGEITGGSETVKAGG
jgi:hypothetical protein